MARIQTRIILVKSLYESNVGASSRAMANMGIKDLILIAPECEFTMVSQKAAATGQEALQGRRVYDSFAEFYANEPEGLRVAFTARDRRGFATENFNKIIPELIAKAPQLQSNDSSTVYLDLIFGPEHWGLSNEDLEQAHCAARIPTYGNNTSLNLAQAVLVAMFMLRHSELGEKLVETEVSPDAEPLRNEEAPLEKLELAPALDEDVLRRWITTLGFNIDDRRASVFTVVRRLFLNAMPTMAEVSSLHAILHQSIRKMGEYHEMRKQLGLEKAEGGKGLPLKALSQASEPHDPEHEPS